MPSISTRHLSPYITLFLLLPLILFIIPNPLERLYQIATFNMTMTDQGDHHDYDHDHETQGHEHNHSHSHSHDHDDNTTEDTTTSSTSTSFLEKNRAHWNSQATTYTSAPWAAEMLNSIHAFILTHISWIGVPFISPSASDRSSRSWKWNNRSR